MKKNRLYISTIAPDARLLAVQYGLGLELAECCTAANMDDHWAQTRPLIEADLAAASRRIFHGPVNELYPSAIDPKAVQLARERLEQAFSLSLFLGVKTMVVHSGHVPMLYFDSWFVERSVLFWKDFLKDKPAGSRICMENVLEEDPKALIEVAKQVDDPRFCLCLDVGHTNAVSPLPVMDWVQYCAPFVGHFHLHNNDGTWDHHRSLENGSIPMESLLRQIDRLCPDVTFTIETAEARSSLHWLEETGLLEE